MTLLTVEEVADRLGVGARVVYRLVADREIEAVRVGRGRRCIRIADSAVESYVDRGRVPAKSGSIAT